MNIQWRQGALFAAGIAAGAAVAAWLILGERGTTPKPAATAPTAVTTTAAAPTPAPAPATVTATATATASGDACPATTLLAAAGAKARPDAQGRKLAEVPALLVEGKEAAASGEPAQAEVAFVTACAVALRENAQPHVLADAQYQLARHYGTLALGAPAGSAGRQELASRAEHLYARSLAAYRAKYGDGHEKTRFAARGLDDMRGTGTRVAGAGPAVGGPSLAAAPMTPASSTPTPSKADVARARAEAAKAEQAKAELARAELARAEAAKAEQARADIAKAQAAKADAASAQAAALAAAKAQVASEAARAEAAKAEAARAATRQAELAKAEAARAEAAKAAARQAEAVAKAERDRAGAAKAQAARAESARVQAAAAPAAVAPAPRVRPATGSATGLGERPAGTAGAPTPAAGSAAARPSFDCSKARSASEKIICSDPELARQDRELGRLHSQARNAAPDPREFKRQSDEQWRQRESTCRDRECLEAWYAQRRQQLMNDVQEAQQ